MLVFSVLLPIYILDVNDNYPIFNQDTITSNKVVNEHSLPSTIIAVIIATDVDGPFVDYMLM